MKNRVCFVIPYFGILPNYFALFLKTCAYNENFNWLLITDDKTPYDYPKNFRVVRMSFEANCSLIQSKFDFPIALKCAYKLCDYKPAYGYIYSEYLKEYTHWGHCDTDVLMGNLDLFLKDQLLDKYDKLFCLGHMTIYKNSDENNRIFMNCLNGKYIFKDVYSTDMSCCFDEVWRDENNVNTLFEKADKHILSLDYSLNIDFGSTRFVRVIYVGRDIPNNGHGYIYEKYKPCIYLWENGHIIRYYKDNNELEREEFMYMHLQKRKMKVCVNKEASTIKIVPNSFLPLEFNKVTLDNFDAIKKRNWNCHYWRIIVLPKLKRITRKLGI